MIETTTEFLVVRMGITTSALIWAPAAVTPEALYTSPPNLRQTYRPEMVARFGGEAGAQVSPTDISRIRQRTRFRDNFKH